MVWAIVYVTWKYRLKAASNNRVLVQSGLLMRPTRARMSNSLLENENVGLPEMQQFCLCVMLLNATRFMLQN